MALQNQLDKIKLPNHLAIIMDGNGRWAKQKGLLRAIGHENGTKSVRTVVEACAELSIPFLTLYAFSTENWNRPKREVELLMKLLVSSLKKEIKTLQDNDIKLIAIGNLDALPKKVHRELQEVMQSTKGNTNMTLTLALSYGSREELIKTVKEISHKV
ncbi:MAG: undecaprenyl diphosphate synthase, partial [Ulvibacter sp.]